MSVNYFVNDKYRVLACMAKRQISVKETSVVKLTQQEIADILQISKVKVNGILNELKKDGYVTQVSPRGKYALTSKTSAALAEIDIKRKK